LGLNPRRDLRQLVDFASREDPLTIAIAVLGVWNTPCREPPVKRGSADADYFERFGRPIVRRSFEPDRHS
jgi:hypothetical protein